uniref:Serine-threonine/tyrosine-protein kinase catalytic domain-containing protein n=1 Tax=Rhizophagus irregularis (strain DAOM 181602 / DAOM 197198 / MUCL 43194) TaxID=747089 RepID=U9T0J6_RHIID
MWEISSGQPPFINYEYNYDLAMEIVNGMRPKLIPGTPLEYKKLMEQCWDADPIKRPNADTLEVEIQKLLIYFQNDQNNDQNEIKEQIVSNQHLQLSDDYMSNHTSKFYQFKNFPEPKNATEEEQEVDEFVNKSKSNSVCKDVINNANFHSGKQAGLDISNGNNSNIEYLFLTNVNPKAVEEKGKDVISLAVIRAEGVQTHCAERYKSINAKEFQEPWSTMGKANIGHTSPPGYNIWLKNFNSDKRLI